ncbi:MAG: Phenylalanine--tRNA ligase alpha subunit [candidate division BRC1 bacterium ADurb.BinA364]|nr:MAG: Phenylalanine--tRNA ligase alpha subunit [candidate division BRC1 bacterium ADurb.BinA364]
MDIESILKEFNVLRNRAMRSVQMVRGAKALESARKKYLGEDGMLAELDRKIAGLAEEARPLASQTAASVKEAIAQACARKLEQFALSERQNRLAEEKIDISLCGAEWRAGRRHPLIALSDDALEFFQSLGFSIILGPDIETEFYNFEALNMPPHHVARDSHPAFAVGADALLRTHLAPACVRFMLERQPPLAAICPGRVHLRQPGLDASTEIHRIEGVMAGDTIRLSDLKGVVDLFSRHLLGEEAGFRMRPVYCQFAEPCCEIDLTAPDPESDSDDPRVWENALLGGMIRPEVFENVGYDPLAVNGFWFRMDVHRLAEIRHGAAIAGALRENDVRLLRQF